MDSLIQLKNHQRLKNQLTEKICFKCQRLKPSTFRYEFDFDDTNVDVQVCENCHTEPTFMYIYSLLDDTDMTFNEFYSYVSLMRF
jgi:RNase P subunit RPR2